MFLNSLVDLPNLAISWIKQVNEGCGDDDTSTEIPREEVDNQRNLEPSHTFGEDWKECDGGRHDQNDEQS